MMWAYTWTEYVRPGERKTGIFKPLWDSINYTDFVVEIWATFKFYFDYARNKPGTHTASSGRDDKQYDAGFEGPRHKADFGEAFGFNRRRGGALPPPVSASPNSYDENIRLTLYDTHQR